MHVGHRLARIARSIAAAVALLAALVGPAVAPEPAAAAGLPAWHGGIDLYRSGVFTTQQTWQWCTAADVQIIRNIVEHGTDHSRSNQQHYFSAMRAHNRYDIPVSDGVDPAGWTYGLRHYVDNRYRLVASGSFNAALRSAVTSLRKTNLPVGITVAHGNHAWVLTGFTATADPARTTTFTITSVRVSGPLWGLQSRSYGYDMRPDTKLTPKQFAGFFTPWHYARIRMAWEGRWVSIQPIGTLPAEAATPPTRPAATRAPTAGPSAPPTPSPGPTPAPSTVVATPSSSTAPSGSTDGGLSAAAGSPPPAGDTPTSAVGDARPTDNADPVWVVLGVLAALAIALAGVRALSRRPRSSPG